MASLTNFVLIVLLLAAAGMAALLLQRRYYRRLLGETRESAADFQQEHQGMREAQQRYGAVLQGMREAVVLMRKDGEILLVNPAFEKTFGVKPQAACGRNVLEILRNKDLQDVLRRCLQQGKEQSDLVEIPGEDIRYFEVLALYLPAGESGEMVLAVLHDVTALKKAETVRRDFVANVSHELRTPLGSIVGSVETLLDGAMQDKAACREFLIMIQSNTQRLKALIGDLLDLAKIESQGEVFQMEILPLLRVAEEAAHNFEKRLAGKGLRVQWAVPENLHVLADAKRIKQVFNNLLDNAIKFTPEGGTLRVAAEGKNGMVAVRVEDSGPGIPPEALDRVFERFYRVEKDRQRQTDAGTGLGLSIAKHIVEKHGGRIWAESPRGGAVFVFTLRSA